MATINLGAIKFNWRGAYAGGTAYTVDDVVSSGGSSYVCILASTGNAVSNATYWSVMAQTGTNGTNGTNGTDVGTTITTQGDLLYRDGSGLQRLAKPASTMNLQMTSGGTPSWIAPASGVIKSIHYKQSTDAWSQTCANTGTAITDGTVAFNIVVTPDSSSSKFIIGASFSHVNITATSGGMGGYFLVERAISGGATTDIVGDADGSRFRGTFNNAKHAVGYEKGATMQIFDAPATASAITYTLQQGSHSATNTCYFGYDAEHANTNAAGYNNTGLSTMWVQEYA